MGKILAEETVVVKWKNVQNTEVRAASEREKESRAEEKR
jgi:hypothetical protein